MVSKVAGVRVARWGKTEIGSLFQRFRRVKGVTQRGLARDLSTSFNYIWMIEAGKALPSLELLGNFCEWAGFNINLAKIYLLNDKVNIYKEKIAKKLNLVGVLR